MFKDLRSRHDESVCRIVTGMRDTEMAQSMFRKRGGIDDGAVEKVFGCMKDGFFCGKFHGMGENAPASRTSRKTSTGARFIGTRKGARPN